MGYVASAVVDFTDVVLGLVVVVVVVGVIVPVIEADVDLAVVVLFSSSLSCMSNGNKRFCSSSGESFEFVKKDKSTDGFGVVDVMVVLLVVVVVGVVMVVAVVVALSSSKA